MDEREKNGTRVIFSSPNIITIIFSSHKNRTRDKLSASFYEIYTRHTKHTTGAKCKGMPSNFICTTNQYVHHQPVSTE